MNTAERSQVQHILHARCKSIADRWYDAVARVWPLPCSTAEARRRLAELTERVIASLLAQPFDHEQARAIGASLASLRHTPAEVLGQTQVVLAGQLVAGLPADQIAALYPRLAMLLGELANGFFEHAREAILAEQEAEQENARTMLIEELQRAGETLRRRNRELALLNQAGWALNSTLDLDQVLATVLEEVTRVLGVVACSVWVIDPETEELICRQATGPYSEVVRGWRLAPGEGLVGWVVRYGESLSVPDTQADERHFEGIDQQTGMGLRSILTVPLRTKQEIIGALQVTDTEVGRFSPSDVTLSESLAASAAIAIDNARLVEALRQRTAELQARNQELDAFAHTVAHDLKGPLTPVISYAELMALDYGDAIGPAGLSQLRKIAQTGRKMGNIIEDLLRLSELRDREALLKPLDMAALVAEAQQRLAYEIEEHQGEVILPESWPAVLGHDTWVEGVWVNYLSNALKYGGRPPRVELGWTAQADGMVRFWVHDNGPGLTPEEQAQLFTPFTRLQRARAKGHGVGLSIVRRILEKLGGQVGVESEIGAGSTFWFTLPAASHSTSSLEDRTPTPVPADPSTGRG